MLPCLFLEQSLQAIRIGRNFQHYGLKFKKIYSSEWCRCKETARLLNLGPVTQHKGLSSFYQNIVQKDETLASLKSLIKNLRPDDLPVLMVTHFVVINSMTGLSIASGGVVEYDPVDGHATIVNVED